MANGGDDFIPRVFPATVKIISSILCCSAQVLLARESTVQERAYVAAEAEASGKGEALMYAIRIALRTALHRSNPDIAIGHSSCDVGVAVASASAIYPNASHRRMTNGDYHG
jgi:hypothetical protein